MSEIPSFQSQIDKEVRWVALIFWGSIKFVIAYLIIENIEYGLYIVVGYLLFSSENQQIFQHLNVKEGNYHFSMLYNKLESIETELSKTTSKVEELEEEVFDIKYGDDDDDDDEEDL